MTIILPPNSTGTTVRTTTLASTDLEHVIIAGDGATAEVSGVVNVQPAETEYGLVTRGFERVDGETLSTANLGISGVFTGAWNDGNLDGTAFVEAAAFADEVSAASGFVIEGSDDTSDANFTRTLDSFTVIASTLATIQAAIPTRFWRVKYTNGGTAQTSFRLTAAARNRVVPAVDSAGQAQVDVLTLPANASVDVAQIAGTATSVNTGTRDAGTQRVTVATDDLVPISAASLPLPAGAATSALQLADGHNVTVDNAGAGAAVNIQDGGNVITVDATLLDIRALTNSDVVTVEQSSAASLKAEVIGTGTFATQDSEKIADNAAFVDGTTPLQPAGFVFDDVAGTSLTENDLAAARIDSKRAQAIVLEDGTTRGQVAAVSAGGALTVDGSAVTQPISAASLPLPSGAATSAAQLADGHNVTIDNAGAGSAVNIQDGGNTITVDGTVSVDLNAGTNTNEVVGDVAAGVAAAGNPVLVAARANANEPTAVADAESTYLWADLQGRLVVTKNFPAAVAVDSTHGPKTTTLTGTGDVALVVAPGAGQSIYVTHITGSNTSSTGVRLDFKDGTTSRKEMFLAADGGGAVIPFDPPWKITANTAFNGALSAAVTDVRVGTHYFVAP